MGKRRSFEQNQIFRTWQVACNLSTQSLAGHGLLREGSQPESPRSTRRRPYSSVMGRRRDTLRKILRERDYMTKKSEENPSRKPTPAWAGMPAKQRTEINSLKAEIRRMQHAEAKYLRAMAEWKEQLSWIRARLDQMERLLPSTTQDAVVERRLKAHHARAGSR